MQQGPSANSLFGSLFCTARRESDAGSVPKKSNPLEIIIISKDFPGNPAKWSARAEGALQTVLDSRAAFAIALQRAFLDHESGPSSHSNRKLSGRRHSTSPNHLPGTLENWPTTALAARNAPGQKHLLQFPDLPAALRTVRVPGTPVSKDQWRTEQFGIQSHVLSISFARCDRPVNHFQEKACSQFWNINRCFASRREIDHVLVRMPR